MRRITIAARAERELALPARNRVSLSGRAPGYIGAAEEDQARWLAAFQRLLDSMQQALQCVLTFETGDGGGRVEDGRMFRPGDLDFAERLRRRRTAQRRTVEMVVDAQAADAVALGLAEVGLSGVRAREVAGRTWRGAEAVGAWRAGDHWYRTWFLERFPGIELEPGWLLRLVPPGLHLTLAWHAVPVPTSAMVEYLQRQLAHMRASRAEANLAGGADPTLDGALPAAERLQRRLTGSLERAFQASLYLTLRAGTQADLSAGAAAVEAAARGALCQLQPCSLRMADGFLCTRAAGFDPLGRTRIMDSSSLATLYPWLDPDLQQPDGLVVGTSRATGAPVLIDPFDATRFANANIGVFGHSGAGKTHLLSSLVMGALGAGAQVLVMDPEHEYGRLARGLGGIDVNLTLGSGQALNVLQLRPGAAESIDEGWLGPAVADAVDLLAIICGTLDEAERAEAEAALRSTYARIEVPILADLMPHLREGSRLQRVLSRWVQGSLGRLFSAPTNVDFEAPIINFAMREMREELVGPVHFLLAEALWSRIKSERRRRVLVVDELGLLFEDRIIRKFVVTLARRIRKYEGSLVFATQNPGDLLSSEAGAVVATNPAIHFLGSQRPGEAGRLQAAFRLSPAQRLILESARRGDFLLCAGAERLAIRVETPEWQLAAIRAARAPPVYSQPVLSPGIDLELGREGLDLRWPAGVRWHRLSAHCRLADGTDQRSSGWRRGDAANAFSVDCGPLEITVSITAAERPAATRILVSARARSAARVVEIGLIGDVEVAGSAPRWMRYNGFQSWDQSGVLPVPSGDGRPRWRESWWAGCVGDPRGGGLAFAATSAERAGTVFRARESQFALLHLGPQALVLEPVLWQADSGDAWEGEPVLLAAGANSQRELGRLAFGAPSRPVPQGWLSWYHYGPFVSADDVRANAAFVARPEWADLGYRLIQIDDGWQQAYGDWEPNSKFPGGIAAVAEALTANGQATGVWTAPFLVSASSDLAHRAPDDWFLLHPVTGSREIDHRHQVFGPMYVLDASHRGVQDHLETTFAGLRRDGVSYFKIDFLYAGAYAGLPAFRAGVAAIRRGVGDAYLLACGAPLLPVVGLVDGCRVAQDTASPIFNFELGAPQPTIFGDEVRSVARNVASRAPLRGWFQIDADVALVGGNLTVAQARQLVSIAALSGGPFFASDNLDGLDPERRALLTNPEVLALVGGEPAIGDWDPTERDLPPAIWRRPDGVIGVFNFQDVPATVTLSTDGASAMRDLWERTDLAIEGGVLEIDLPADGVRLLGPASG